MQYLVLRLLRPATKSYSLQPTAHALQLYRYSVYPGTCTGTLVLYCTSTVWYSTLRKMSARRLTLLFDFESWIFCVSLAVIRTDLAYVVEEENLGCGRIKIQCILYSTYVLYRTVQWCTSTELVQHLLSTTK